MTVKGPDGVLCVSTNKMKNQGVRSFEQDRDMCARWKMVVVERLWLYSNVGVSAVVIVGVYSWSCVPWS